MNVRRTVLITLVGLSLSGCAALTSLGDASRPLEIFELRTPEPVATSARASSVEIVVEEPVASGSLGTERIMIRPAPYQAQYLPGVRWSDPAPAMLQTILVRTLTETGAFGSVGRSPIGGQGDFALLSELTDFQAESREGDGGTIVRLRLIARLVDEGDASVVATRIFAQSAPAASSGTEDVVAAFDRALVGLLAELTPWLAARVAAAT